MWCEAGGYAETQAVRSLLCRIVDGLGIQLVTLRDNERLVVSNLSMSLTGEELMVLARLTRGERPTPGP